MSPLDLPLHVSIFTDFAARTIRRETLSLRQLLPLVLTTSAASKAALPWLKLAVFGEARSPKGALRHNANLTAISGVELDYDAELTTMNEAAAMLQAAGLAALLYDSPSSMIDLPRWRILLPCSKPLPASERAALAARVNGLLGGTLSVESFTLSQAYYFGFVASNTQHRAVLVDGRPIDLASELDTGARYPARATPAQTVHPVYDPGATPDQHALAAQQAAVDMLLAMEGGDTHPTLLRATAIVAPFVLAGLLDEDEVSQALAEACEDAVRTPNLGEMESALAGALRKMRPYEPATGGTEFETAPLPDPSPPRSLVARPFVWRDPAAIPPREWIYGGHYIRKFLSATVAPGGLGKSSHALVEALDMVTGRGLLTGKPGPKRRVAYWNGEDPLEETERRIAAACLHYGITAEDIGDRLFIQSGRDAPIILATEDRDGLQIARPVTATLIAEARENALDVLIVDPFVKAHAVSENDNGAVDAVATQFAAIADAANISVELIHHLRKASGQGQDRTADDARGASALVSAARSVRVLNPMQQQDAEALGIADEQRRRYFRVDDGKANLMPPSDRTVWRCLASVNLGNSRPGMASDSVGVAASWEKPELEDSITPAQVAEVCRRLEAGAPARRDARSPEWIGVWASDVLGVEAGNKKRAGKLIDMLIGQRLLFVSHVPNGKGRAVEVVGVSPQSPQSDCGVTVGTVGITGPQHPHTSPVWGVGSECGVSGGVPQSEGVGT